MSKYDGRKVLIMGLGVHGGGISAAKYFAKQGATVTVTDLKPAEEFEKSLEVLKEFSNISYVLGEHRDEDFKNTDFVIRNPGVPRESKYLQIARDNNVDIQMVEGIFFRLCPTKNIIGITGTKGKTTTSYLVHTMLQGNGLTAHLGGNMKIPVLDLLPDIKPDDWVVLELSSWQCEALEDNQISPRVGVITNISQDHLNRYSSYEEYAMSKVAIFKYPPNEIFITIADEEFTEKFALMATSHTFLFDSKKHEIRDVQSDSGYKLDQDVFTDSKIRGAHNNTNMLCAMSVSHALELDEVKSLNALKSFPGVPYRMEEIGEIEGVKFVDDTTSTAPAAALAALKTYKEENPVILLGGSDKNLDYQGLARYVQDNNVNYVLLKGEATEKLIKEGVRGDKVYDDFTVAVTDAFQKAKEVKGIVLLSPGAASFGMFKHEFDRGDQFREIFEKLKNDNHS